MHRFVRAVAAVGIAGLMAACGSDAEDIDTTKVLTREQYIEVSDDICADYQKRIIGIVSSAKSNLTLEEAKAILNDQVIPLYQAEHKELVALKPPAADVKKMKAALREMNRGINENITGVKSASSIAALDAIVPSGIQEWRSAVGDYGMTSCGPSNATTTSEP